jgi:apolipoprotein N-acyltransferase
VRAANTGITAVVDPLGRIVRSLPLGSDGVLDAPLPKPMSVTPYARFGDLPAMVIVAIAFVFTLRQRTRNGSAQ